MLEYLYGKMFGSKIAWANRKDGDKEWAGPSASTLSLLTGVFFFAMRLCTKYNTWSVNRTVTEIVIILEKNKAIKMQSYVTSHLMQLCLPTKSNFRCTPSGNTYPFHFQIFCHSHGRKSKSNHCLLHIRVVQGWYLGRSTCCVLRVLSWFPAVLPNVFR